MTPQGPATSRFRPVPLLSALLFMVGVSGCGSSNAPAAPVASSQPTTCPIPTLMRGTVDPQGSGQLFSRVDAGPITDTKPDASDEENSGVSGTQIIGNGGIALLDMNGDGLDDVFITYNADPVKASNPFALYLNQGCFTFKQQPITLQGSLPNSQHAIPVFADFNDDGLLDFFLTRNGDADPDGGPANLLIAQGDQYTFKDLGAQLGITGNRSHQRQAQFGDINGDGWLDIVVGSDQIGSGNSTHSPTDQFSTKSNRDDLDQQFMYIYQPAPSGRFEDGHFVEVGGDTSIIQDFGGRPQCNPDVDRASPGILLRDIDDDGDLDIIQPAQVDQTFTPANNVCSPGEQRTGVWAWKNQLKETGQLTFEKQQPGSPGSIAEEGRSRWATLKQEFVPQADAVSHAYVAAADVNNDGKLDIITFGSTDLDFHVQTEHQAFKFWDNLGNFLFSPTLDYRGLTSLNWNYSSWGPFFNYTVNPLSPTHTLACTAATQRVDCLAQQPSEADTQIYPAGVVFADFNNDGWIDMLVEDRHVSDVNTYLIRDVIYMNDHGTFYPLTSFESGVASNSIGAEVADFNGDGLLDLYLSTDPYNTGAGAIPNLPKDLFLDKIYWNRGALGGLSNHWMRVKLEGLPMRKLLGSRLFAYDAQTGELIGRRDLFPVDGYKASHGLNDHFGLGQHTQVRLEITLPDGTQLSVPKMPIDSYSAVDVGSGAVRNVRPTTIQVQMP